MATVKSYVDAYIPQSLQSRYDRHWVSWTNALLERLSGAGILLPKRLTSRAAARGGVWVDKPPMCRDVLEIRRGGTVGEEA
jgi:hypothetical protein